MAFHWQLPAPLRVFFSYFPLYTHPAILPPGSSPKKPTLWVLPPRSPDSGPLSSDVECLKWQAYLALRGLTDIAIRCDIHPVGALDGRLPNLQIPSPLADGVSKGELLAPHLIPAWVDARVEGAEDPLEGYKDEAARDESRAWVALLEGNVHAALVLSQSKPFSLWSLISAEPNTMRPIETLLSPPPAPLSGFSSLFPPYGTRVSTSAVELQYREAIASLSERLGRDKWFLGSPGPTPLDALAFAYLHSILHAPDVLRIEVARRVNLVAWEKSVRAQVVAAFHLVAKTEDST